MDKRVIFAVAGSGKTTHIVSRLDIHRRYLLITYTDNNLLNLRQKIVAKFGYLPSNILLYSYFSFLNRFCFKPFLFFQMRTKGINFETPPPSTLKIPRTSDRFYLDSHRRLYSNRIANLLLTRGVIDDLGRRVEKYADVICVDEVQDIGGYDFDLLLKLCQRNLEVLLVGDFYQHTFVTSQDGPKNANLYDDYEKYKQRFRDIGLTVDTTSLEKSHRCSPTVCKFIRERLGIDIHSHLESESDVAIVASQHEVNSLHANSGIVKLFYKDHHKYDCYSYNWGGSKGLDHFRDVCVVLNKTTLKAYETNALHALKPQTRNRLYVACSRPHGNLILIPEVLLKQYRPRK